MDPNSCATQSHPLSLLIPARAVAGDRRPVACDDECRVSVARGHDEVDWFRVLPLYKATADTINDDMIIGLLVDNAVIWCRKGPESTDPDRLRLVRIASTEVITAEVKIVLPQVIEGCAMHQLRNRVPVEGPADMLPWRVVVTSDEVLNRQRLTIGDLRLPLYCETIGLPLAEEIATLTKKESDASDGLARRTVEEIASMKRFKRRLELF